MSLLKLNCQFLTMLFALISDCGARYPVTHSFTLPQVCTVEDRNELEQSVPSAKDINRFYGAKLSLHEDLKAKLKLSLAKVF